MPVILLGLENLTLSGTSQRDKLTSGRYELRKCPSFCTNRTWSSWISWNANLEKSYYPIHESTCQKDVWNSTRVQGPTCDLQKRMYFNPSNGNSLADEDTEFTADHNKWGVPARAFSFKPSDLDKSNRMRSAFDIEWNKEKATKTGLRLDKNMNKRSHASTASKLTMSVSIHLQKNTSSLIIASRRRHERS